jgi:hypothetical protein
MSNRFYRIMMIGLMLSSLISLTSLAAKVFAERPARRIEIYPIQTVTLSSSQFLNSEKQSSSDICELEERSGGLVVNRATGEPWKPTDNCCTKGTTLGGDLTARNEAIESVKNFLKTTFNLQ